MNTGPSNPGVATRVAATRVLDDVMHRGRSLKAVLTAALPPLADARDRAMVEAIVFTALRQHARFDAALAQWLQKPLGGRLGELRALMHVGFAQQEMGVPAHAGVAATVDAARALGLTHQAGMVNAILRRAQREGLPQLHDDASWPHWLSQRIRQDWPCHAESIFPASAQVAPMWLRVNPRDGSRDDYLQRLTDAGIEASALPEAPDAIRLSTPLPVHALPGFETGSVSVQDAAAQRVADALAPASGARVLDACAAPGGKAAHLLERDPTLQLTALDIDPRRVRRMQDTFKRLGLQATTRAADAAQPSRWWDGAAFDAILIDAPCSATGIVRRQPDVLLHRREADIAALNSIQSGLLDALWPLLAPGGTLVYATCSILRAENAGQVEAFLARMPDAILEPLDAGYGHDTGCGHQRLPGELGMDGFFYARLRKA
ncbi:MAG: 16S rRNA (cytosine(967)-C(5))-methyltransferase RsmB [Pseudomonadota bacterium]|nr:16S rRNA (cytosine(967)-C(5))-methyltransferase RsmB [Pseudomonadota bacterium]MDQ3160637.1 16S rRNA (cytosine(967)-C(5))-methyltransferase RsmB [Pseudomonadota bacterium]